MLRADNLVFGYGPQPLLRNVSIDVPPGATLGVIGPNGSGKTTLLRLLAGTRRPSHGEVTLDGRPIHTLRREEVARRLAVVPQETHPAFDYSVLEIVLMGRYPHLGTFAVEGPGDIAVARAALAATGTSPFETRPFSSLSGGEKQRVVIAAALAQIASESAAPVAMLLDEPTAALDLRYQIAVGNLLLSLHRERRLTLVVSTHDLTFAARLCSRLIMLKGGEVVAAGATREVLTPSRVSALYEVDVDVLWHPAGAVSVVPRAGTPPRPQA